MYVFNSLGDRDSFTEATEGTTCRVGGTKYVLDSEGQWREVVNALSLVGQPENVVCTCDGCVCK